MPELLPAYDDLPCGPAWVWQISRPDVLLTTFSKKGGKGWFLLKRTLASLVTVVKVASAQFGYDFEL